ncbi:hypothetical protein Dsin_032066 [Dipteronia sinensis]|uniref:Uncharacterized protein n=1 Tax=Dipteronia sinensis TaxID=43782 RepID=A0AAD9ZMR1_9ROSI|nr:hypothetical protein Dsin_032066 [Dipteronia sinensis]
MDALESRVDAHNEILSKTQATLSTVVDRLNGLETDYTTITQTNKAMLREFQMGIKEDLYLLTQEVLNNRTFVEQKFWNIQAEMDEVRTEWASYHNNRTVNFGAITSTNAIQIPKLSTFNGNRDAMEVENLIFGLEQYF